MIFGLFFWDNFTLHPSISEKWSILSKLSREKDQKSFSDKIKFFQCVEYFHLSKSFGIRIKVDLSTYPDLIDCFQNFQEMWYVLINEAQRDTEGILKNRHFGLFWWGIPLHFKNSLWCSYCVQISAPRCFYSCNSEVRKTNL